jgi:hypothetical protein
MSANDAAAGSGTMSLTVLMIVNNQDRSRDYPVLPARPRRVLDRSRPDDPGIGALHPGVAPSSRRPRRGHRRRCQ